jgi:hypothetical protein
MVFPLESLETGTTRKRLGPLLASRHRQSYDRLRVFVNVFEDAMQSQAEERTRCAEYSELIEVYAWSLAHDINTV